MARRTVVLKVVSTAFAPLQKLGAKPQTKTFTKLKTSSSDSPPKLQFPEECYISVDSLRGTSYACTKMGGLFAIGVLFSRMNWLLLLSCVVGFDRRGSALVSGETVTAAEEPSQIQTSGPC